MRILLAIFLFEVAGYGTLTLHNKSDTQDALLNVRQRQLGDVFEASTSRLNGLTDHMESVARGLATTGSRLRHLKQAGVDVVAEVQAYLTQSVTQLPDAIGGGLWYEPNTFDPKETYFGPYVSWDKGAVKFTWDLNTPKYDYHNQSWYRVAIPAAGVATLRPAKSTVWTEPYKDDAGTQSLMITVDAYMYDDAGKIIGLSTVDWSLEQIQRFVGGIRMTEHSSVFLIDSRSGLVIADSMSPATLMTPAARSSWLDKIALTTKPNDLQTIPSIDVAGVASVVKYARTNAGLVFGIRVPLEEFGAEATAIAVSGAKVSVAVAVFFITLGALMLHLLFRPFRHVVQLINKSTSKRDARGEFVVQAIEYRSQNEFKGIVMALNAMTAGISERDRRLAAYASGLEQKVAERTAELNQRNDEVAARNDEMRVVMDNVNQGLLTIDRRGVVAAARSAAVTRWFGDVPPGTTVSTLLQRFDDSVAYLIAIGVDELFEELMPPEVTVDQLPHHITIRTDAGPLDLRIDYTPIRDAESKMDRVLVLFSDETVALAAARQEIQERENLAVFTRIMHDRAGFVAFFQEATEIVTSLASPMPADVVKRKLHTFKGNVSMFGIVRLAAAVHDLENAMAEDAREPTHAELAAVTAMWTEFGERMRIWLGDSHEPFLEVEDAEYQTLLRGLLDNRPGPELARQVQSWRLEPAARRLARLGEQAQNVAERLGRAPLEIEVESNAVRLDAEIWNGFWSSLVHVARNAIDHGIEDADERTRAGKPSAGRLSLRTALADRVLEVAIADDGRGILWDRVADKARAAGLPVATHADLVQALFADGVSTRDEATELSGRGVGMAAVLAVVQALGGTVAVTSAPGQGTCFTFRFPLDAPPLRSHGATLRVAFAAEARAA